MIELKNMHYSIYLYAKCNIWYCSLSRISQIYKCIGYVRILFHLRCPPVLGFLVFCYANDFQRQLKLIEMK